MHTWKEAAARWHAMGTHRTKETIRREVQLLRWLGPQLDEIDIATISRAHLYSVREKALKARWTPRSVNYAVQLVGTVIRAANDWEWLDKPVPRIKPMKMPPGRTRWMNPQQFWKLAALLPQPQRDMAILATFTGLRRGNICGLLWSWVDVARAQIVVPAGVVKSRVPLTVPLVPEALAVIQRRTQARILGNSLVFHRRGRPVNQPNGHSWFKALAALGIDDFRWHDLRHSWASWHVQAGTTLPVLKEAGGWKTLSMVTRYAHLDTRSLRAAAAAMAAWQNQPMEVQEGLLRAA